MNFQVSDLVGTWQADYGRKVLGLTGIETFVLKDDGTYQQIFDDGEGYKHTSSWNKWWLEEGHTVHLENGRFYLQGLQWAEWLEQGDALIDTIDRMGRKVSLDGTEILLYTWPDDNDPKGVILEHLPTGDGDHLRYVRFHRLATLGPESTNVP